MSLETGNGILAKVDEVVTRIPGVGQVVDWMATRVIPRATAHGIYCDGRTYFCYQRCDPEQGQCGGHTPYVLNYYYADDLAGCRAQIWTVCAQVCSYNSNCS